MGVGGAGRAGRKRRLLGGRRWGGGGAWWAGRAAERPGDEEGAYQERSPWQDHTVLPARVRMSRCLECDDQDGGGAPNTGANGERQRTVKK